MKNMSTLTLITTQNNCFFLNNDFCTLNLDVCIYLTTFSKFE